ncbi:MAG: GHKL domain-containing protein, partial [Oscillospiraceae bacterium]|nr:GHKL domain-containing protein [Oscillospiraceae bacterium]
EDLIFLSKMEEDVKLTVIEFPLSDLAEEAAKSFESLAKTQSKSFTYDIEPNVAVTGDQKGIRQLMNVLLDNAIKYSPEGGKIRLELKKSGRGAHISVSNTAEDGISREKLSHMFDRFYRGDASRSEKSGYGIGLSIAKAVVEAHKGKISASTPDGKTMVIEATI